ncbi:Por secretion system C-terminal sorting domain-containing protein [Flaviramulus basaltis]|uniref:Por secretion system C-terminal sorting domain-containing protein n=1 Tax=Flaviramulus basaltis TaxID=369401 RepID=A0A1K2IQ61_9FLAO|nr:T9SS type A sorting domain-containing protein [Flaviramulus basaltis]SFZ94336.1 Por secretion system C-terminal sorting domain-containing protein [Flaviramulus basaltis]
MIKKLQCVFLFLFIGTGITTQAQCLFSDTTLETQADVNEFVSLYSDCSTMNYNLTIGSNSAQGTADPVTDISGLSFITTIEDGLTIQYTGLTSLNGLQNLTSVGESFNIYYNDSLTSLNGLQGLTAIGTNTSIANSALGIFTNPVLTDLTALQNLTTLNEGTISVQYSDALTSLNGLENIEASSIRSIVIRYNPQLTNCSAQSLCEALNIGVSGNINITDNDAGCDNELQVVGSCGGYSGCPTENIALETQADVDGFVAAYPNCPSIEAASLFRLYISGQYVDDDFITDLSGLSQFTNLELDNLTIQYTDLTSLDGLQGVISANRINILNNPNLTSLDGLQGLTSVNKELIISYNPSLLTFSGIDNLTSINAEGTNSSALLDMEYNPLLLELDALSNLQTVNNLTIWVVANDVLSSMAGLNNIDANGIVTYGIGFCNNLAVCNVQSFCDVIPVLEENVTLFAVDNAPGCNSITEVSAACNTDLCPPGDVILTSQAEVDAFGATYPNCTSISGALAINGTDIINLSGLANIHYLSGDVIIQNTQLTSLNDLAINGINGSIEISGNTQLTSIATALSTNIASLKGNLSIVNNDALTSLSGLENIKNINTSAAVTAGLTISDNDNLTDMTALSALETLNGSELIIDNNAALTTLSGLDNVFANTISNLSIQNNSNLTNASATSICIYLNNSFPATISGNATGAATSIEILNNCNLPDCPPSGDFVFDRVMLDYFKIQYPNCTELDGNVVFSNLNDAGGDLSGLDNITSIIGDLYINSNMGYSSLAGLENLNSIGGDFEIVGCESITNLQGLNGLISVGTSGAENITFRITKNDNLQNLSGLEGLTTLIGNINITISFNPALTSLQGLNNVTTIITTPSSFGLDDYFIINDNENLASLEGLNSLQTLYSHLRFQNLPALADISALSNLVSITGDVNFQNCDALTTFNGLENLNFIYGDLFIVNNNALQNLNGLNNLQTVYALELSVNSALTNIQALSSLTTITEEDLMYSQLNITGNPLLQSLDGLEGLTSLGDLWIDSNVSLTSIEGLQNVTDIGVGIVIVNNINLTSLTGLNNLQRLHQSPYIGSTVNLYFGNNALTSLAPLSNLTDPVFISLGIVNEQGLTSLSGLDNLNPEHIITALIQNNSQLSTCEVESICGYLASNPDPNYYLIENNATGCNTEIEVIDACATLSIDEADLETSVISFYPNPTQDDLYMDVKGNIEVKNITIYNIMGQLVRTLNGSHELINVSKMDSGVYFVKVNTKTGEVYTQKIIKN